MPDEVRAHIARFTSAEVCKAAGITPETLKNWVSRKPHIVLLKSGDQPGGSRGVPNLYSLNRVLQIAIMAEFVRLGWEPRPAAHAAIHFTDIGGAVAAYWADEVPEIRVPGQLFATGETLLVAMPDDDDAEMAVSEVINVDPKAPWSDFWEEVHTSVLRTHGSLFGPAGVTVIDLGAIVLRVRASLGMDLFE